MSDLRHDPVFDVWVVVAENRRERPLEFVPHDQVRKSLICPFCAGNEDETPPPNALFDHFGRQLDDLTSSAWSTRVIPNRYPAFTAPVEGFSPRDDSDSNEAGPYQRRAGAGLQELVIPSPRHVVSLAELTSEELLVGLRSAQSRIRIMRAAEGIAHTMFFCNCRFEAGASIEHVHFQLIGSPLLSPQLTQRAARMADWNRVHGRPLLAAVAEFEVREQKRMMAAGRYWNAFCPLASRFPFQVWFAPRESLEGFQSCPDESLMELAELTRRYAAKLEGLLGAPGYNWMLHESASHNCGDWFIEVAPRLAKQAGYELGTEIWINPVSPETAARKLR